MSEILTQAAELKKLGTPFVLCMVTETKGSTPRKEGAAMIVLGGGKIIGTIGGGSVEMGAIAEALTTLQTCKPAKKTYLLEDDLNMHCGGTMEVFFYPVQAGSSLYIFGAGHVGREVGKYAAELGFAVTFVDHRAGIFDEFDVSFASTMVSDYVEAAEKISFSAKDYVVITTPQHQYDEALVAYLAKIKLTYIGMIGSKRKVAEISRRLLGEGILTHDELGFVDMPIGIPIRVETPREIAISIVARLIDVKNAQ